MKIIDLTLPMHTGMSVYPGDKPVSIEPVQELERDGWNMRRIEVNGHDGTHVNAPSHGIEGGKTLDEYALDSFCGPAVLYKPGMPIPAGVGVIFRDRNIDEAILEELRKAHPRFVGLSSDYEIDEVIEKELFKSDIILFERLANTAELPDKFMFYGMPLRIREGDGSPIRAFAVV